MRTDDATSTSPNSKTFANTTLNCSNFLENSTFEKVCEQKVVRGHLERCIFDGVRSDVSPHSLNHESPGFDLDDDPHAYHVDATSALSNAQPRAWRQREENGET